MPSAGKRIGIFGNFGIPNFGNDATLQSMLLFLRQTQPDAELVCVCANPEKAQRDHQIAALPMNRPGPPILKKLSNWVYAIETMRTLDMLIIPGTGILGDYCQSPFGMPYVIFRWCLAARLCRKNIALVSVGAGPLHHPITKWFVKSVVSMARYRSYRNNFSKEFLTGLGMNTESDPVYPDLVFRLPTPPSPVAQSGDGDGTTVCVGVMSYNGWLGHLRTDDSIYEEYLRKITEFVLWLLDGGNKVRILVGEAADQKVVEQLRGAILIERPSLPEGRLNTDVAHSSHELMRQMADADIVISSRFHNLIFAMMQGKLTISTGYAEYFAELMADMGMGAFCQHSGQIKTETLIAQFTELMSNRNHYEAITRDAVSAARKRLADQDVVFTSQFLEASSR